MPEDVEGTALFLNGNLIQRVLWEPLKPVTDEMGLTSDVLEIIDTRVHSCFNLSTELGGTTQILSQIPGYASCRFRQSDKVIAHVSVTVQELTLNNLRVRH
jgi:hypothetical protein